MKGDEEDAVKMMRQSSIFLKLCLRVVAGWKAEHVTGPRPCRR